MTHRYRIVFQGKIKEDKNIEDVKANLASLLKKDNETISKLFPGQRIVLKKTSSLEKCNKIKSAFLSAGSGCQVIGPDKDPVEDVDLGACSRENSQASPNRAPEEVPNSPQQLQLSPLTRIRNLYRQFLQSWVSLALPLLDFIKRPLIPYSQTLKQVGQFH